MLNHNVVNIIYFLQLKNMRESITTQTCQVFKVIHINKKQPEHLNSSFEKFIDAILWVQQRTFVEEKSKILSNEK